MAEADVAELQQLFDSVEAKQYKRPDMKHSSWSQPTLPCAVSPSRRLRGVHARRENVGAVYVVAQGPEAGLRLGQLQEQSGRI